MQASINDTVYVEISLYLSYSKRMFPIPRSKRKTALLLVDIQHGFLKKWKKPLVKNLRSLLERKKYDLHVEITFHAEKRSLWDKQTNWTFPYEPTVKEVTDLLPKKSVIQIVKETRSGFKGNIDLEKILRKKGIREVHIVGLDTTDCVFATAQEAFDLGFYSYVIEECAGASQGIKMHNYAINILRRLGLTNHSK